jgi:inorganic pyrophosphatase
MVAPGILVLGSPLAAGFLFGPDAVAGLLAGIIVSGVQVAISASNTGGAWDNCKKEIEKSRSAHKKRVGEEYENGDDDHKAFLDAETIRIKELHVAAVIGDTVGDPLKDTSGPAINILIKLSAITSLVFGSFIKNNNLSDKLMKAAQDAVAAAEGAVVETPVEEVPVVEE